LILLGHLDLEVESNGSLEAVVEVDGLVHLLIPMKVVDLVVHMLVLVTVVLVILPLDLMQQQILVVAVVLVVEVEIEMVEMADLVLLLLDIRLPHKKMQKQLAEV
tara:strand:+ start:437 stop:751 length:315 start_codon:yes stop_codon:yes gene_type:complete